MAIEFYDVKLREKVSIDEKNVVKVTFESDNGQVRYGLRGKTSDGRPLTKFVSKGDWDSMKMPVEKVEKKKADAKKPAAKKADAKADTKKADAKKPAAKKSEAKKPAAKKPAAKKKK